MQRIKRVLVANRGEIAIRIARSARERAIEPVGVFAEDDLDAPHRHAMPQSVALRGRGARAYLDAAQLIDAAVSTGCDAIHPGYGFLSEQAQFARDCEKAGLRFVGPRPEVLAELGDKALARACAERCGVPVLPGKALESVDDAAALLASWPAGSTLLLKAVSGGGGRGMRRVTAQAELTAAWSQCVAEAEQAFGDGRLYGEAWFSRVRHVEVQVVGDARGSIRILGERDCSLQRRHQKIFEIAPAPGLLPALRAQLFDAAAAMARELQCSSLCTFEFLVSVDAMAGTPDPRNSGADSAVPSWVFIEANPRLQVEHTITEAVFGLDLVAMQFAIADGAIFGDAELPDPAGREARGVAIQARITMEAPDESGQLRPASGCVAELKWPGGPGVRVDTALANGYSPSPNYDGLLAKLVVHAESESSERSFDQALRRMRRALSETALTGLPSSITFLLTLAESQEVTGARYDTQTLEAHALAWGARARAWSADSGQGPRQLAGSDGGIAPSGMPELPEPDPGQVRVMAPVAGEQGAPHVKAGDRVSAGQELSVVSSMKMEFAVTSPVSGLLTRCWRSQAGLVQAGEPLFEIAVDSDALSAPDSVRAGAAIDRAEVVQLRARLASTRDEARPEAIARRHGRGHRTARENIADLCQGGRFIEYGALGLPAQRGRRTLDDLIANAPADGLVLGLAEWPDGTALAVMAYDFTVLAGTQGIISHRKIDRLLEIAVARALPVVLFAEGGGGRPGDTDHHGVTGLDSTTFWRMAQLRGRAPVVGIVSGRCFAGNAALLGVADLIIATQDANIGMAGPAMIEAAGLGTFSPEAIGPAAEQAQIGLIDILVADEAQAVAVARGWLSRDLAVPERASALPGAGSPLQHLPENRLRVYDSRPLLRALVDPDSFVEVKAQHAPAMVTAYARMGDRRIGVLANNPLHRAGAIDAAGARKAAQFLRTCHRLRYPVLSVCDTPGFMVGPDEEAQGMVAASAEMFLAGAEFSPPLLTLVTRKAYGLGAMAMAGGSLRRSDLCAAWPSGEFGGMGIEGAARLAWRRELAAIDDPVRRERFYQDKVRELYEQGQAINLATYFEIDAVIEPDESRQWIVSTFNAVCGRP